MKHLLGITLGLLVFISCSGDDNNDNNTNQEVAVQGTWKLTSIQTETAFDLNNDGTATRDLMAETNCYQNETIEFLSDGTGKAISRSYADIDLEITVGTTNEYSYNIACVAEDDIDSFTYTQNGSNISLDLDGGIITATLDGNKLTYVIQSGFFVETVVDGEVVYLIEDLKFVYTKE